MLNINNKTKLIKIGFLTALLLFAIQTYLFPDAGKQKQNNNLQYTFQLNYWEENIVNKIENIRSTRVLDKIQLKKNKNIKLDKEFGMGLAQYTHLMSDLLRSLKFNANVAINILNETSSLLPKGIKNEEELKSILGTTTHFKESLEIYLKKESRLRTFIPEFISAFTYSDNMTENEKTEAAVKQIKLISELYSSDDLFLKLNGDPFAFISDMGNSSHELLKIYDSLIDEYNKKVSTEETIKQIVISIITIISTLISFKIALIDEDSSTKKDTNLDTNTNTNVDTDTNVVENTDGNTDGNIGSQT